MKFIVNTNGHVFFSCQSAASFHKGMCAVQLDGKWGAINSLGNIVIPCSYDRPFSFDEDNVAVVLKNEGYGLINISGKLLVPCRYKERDSVPMPTDGIVCYNIGDGEERVFKCIDLQGNHLFTKKALVSFEYCEGLAHCWEETGHSVIDKYGNTVIPSGIYDWISGLSYGFFVVTRNAKKGIINKTGETVVSIQYDNIDELYYDVPCPVLKFYKGDTGFLIDVRSGKILISNFTREQIYCCETHISADGEMLNIIVGDDIYIYNIKTSKLFKTSSFKSIGRYSDGLCAVVDKQFGKLGFIDKTSRLVIPCQFENSHVLVSEFHEGTCALHHHIIDKHGNILRSLSPMNINYFRYKEIEGHSYYIENVSDNGHIERLIDSSGKVIFSAWRICDPGTDEFPIAVNNGDGKGYGFIDKNGRIVIPYQFEDEHYFCEGFATVNKIPIQTSKAFSNIKTTSNPSSSKSSSQTQPVSSNGCYIATAVYGCYDCPELWTLRRYRDYILDKTWYGRLFIRCYYAFSPTLVKLLGSKPWFKKVLIGPLNRWVMNLNVRGLKGTPYVDKY